MLGSYCSPRIWRGQDAVVRLRRLRRGTDCFHTLCVYVGVQIRSVSCQETLMILRPVRPVRLQSTVIHSKTKKEFLGALSLKRGSTISHLWQKVYWRPETDRKETRFID